MKTEGFTPKTPVERRDTLGKLSDVPKTASEMEKERLDLENAKSASGQQMLKNVSVMAQETPEILSDRKTFEDMTSFATKPESERRVLEAYWQSKNAPKSESDYFKLLASGQDVFNRNLKTTPEYLRAKTKSDKFKALRQMDSNSMYSELVAGNVPTEFRELLSQSPAFAEANKRFYQKLSTDNINDSTRAIGSAISGTKYSPEDKLESLSERFVSTAPSKTYSELFRSKISSNENIRGLSTTLSAKNEELKKLTEARNNIVKEVKRNFPGMPLALQISYAARQAEPINEQINTMEYEAERISSDLKFETYVANQEFQAESKDLELMNSIGKENRDRSFQKELAIFQNELKNQGIETQIIKDEATGKQALINSKTGAVISSYDTGAKPGSGTTFQQIKQTDELGRETVVGYFDPTTGKSTYYGAGIAHSGTTNIGTNVPVSVNAS